MLIKLNIDDEKIENVVEDLKLYLNESTNSKAALHAVKNYECLHKAWKREKFLREKAESTLNELKDLVREREAANRSIEIILGSKL